MWVGVESKWKRESTFEYVKGWVRKKRKKKERMEIVKMQKDRKNKQMMFDLKCLY